MKRLRPVHPSDIERLFELISTRGAGISSLPQDKDKLNEIIHLSQEAFSPTIEKPDFVEYLFVLEETSSKEIGGTCAIKAKTGGVHPTVFYKIESEKQPNGHTSRIIKPTAYTEGPTEICSLFLHKSWRRGSYGPLLSLSRFLFIATFPHRFTETIIAQIRGQIIDDKECPFWDHFGKHFYPVSREEAIQTFYNHPSEILNHLPQHPVYLDLLPSLIEEVLMEPHDRSKKALEMLLSEGFRKTNEFDITDAGPKIIASKSEVKTIRESREAKVKISSSESGMEAIIARPTLDFRCCYGRVESTEKNVTLSERTARALEVEEGEAVLYRILS